MKTPIVIKLGGAALECSNTLQQLFGAIEAYQQSAQQGVILVHGGGYLVDELLCGLKLETVKKAGLRVTPSDQINYVTGALAGTANKLLQAEAIKAGVKSVGLSLADAGLTKVTVLDPELGHVGKAQPGDSSAVQALLAQGITPIISSIGITAQGELMNVNADQAAVAVAAAVNGELVLLSDVSGVLDGKGHLIPALTSEQAHALIEGKVITEGMIVKVLAALDAAQELGRPIQVASWRYVDKLNALLAGESVGTQFLPQAE